MFQIKQNFSEIAVLKYTPCCVTFESFKKGDGGGGKKNQKLKTKSFCSQMIFPFILKIFFSYTTLYLHLVLFTQN